MTDPTERFSDRTADYVKARPSYPPELLGILRAEGGLSESPAAGGLAMPPRAAADQEPS